MATAYHKREQLKRRRPPWMDAHLAFFCGVCNEWHWKTPAGCVCPGQGGVRIWHPVSDGD